MQQEPIINHGNLIDTYNYAALIYAAANQVSYNPWYRVTRSRKCKRYKFKGSKGKKNSNRKMLKR